MATLGVHDVVVVGNASPIGNARLLGLISDVRQLTRTRPGLSAFRKGTVVGGLTAVVGRRRYLLTDHVESAAEYDHLEVLLDPHDLLTDRLHRPGEDTPPTWLYRRRHHRPPPD